MQARRASPTCDHQINRVARLVQAPASQPGTRRATSPSCGRPPRAACRCWSCCWRGAHWSTLQTTRAGPRSTGGAARAQAGRGGARERLRPGRPAHRGRGGGCVRARRQLCDGRGRERACTDGGHAPTFTKPHQGGIMRPIGRAPPPPAARGPGAGSYGRGHGGMRRGVLREGAARAGGGGGRRLPRVVPLESTSSQTHKLQAVATLLFTCRAAPNTT
jgi:hypothetical protein